MRNKLYIYLLVMEGTVEFDLNFIIIHLKFDKNGLCFFEATNRVAINNRLEDYSNC